MPTIANHISMTVPIAMIRYFIINRKLPELQLFLTMKYTTGGHFKLNKESRNWICNILRWKSDKTFRKHLKWLINHRLVTVNSKTSNYRIVRYELAMRRLKLVGKKSARINYQDLGIRFKAFCYGSVITYYSRYKYFLDCKKGSSVRKTGHTSKNDNSPYLTLPNASLAHFMGVDIATACRYRSVARKAHYIEVYDDLVCLNLPASFLTEEQERCPKLASRMRVLNGKIYIQMPSQIVPCISLVNKNYKCERPKTGWERRLAVKLSNSSP